MTFLIKNLIRYQYISDMYIINQKYKTCDNELYVFQFQYHQTLSIFVHYYPIHDSISIFPLAFFPILTIQQ